MTVVVLTPLYASTASWDIMQSVDPRGAALAGWSLATTGDLAYDERWPAEAAAWEAEGRDGRGYSNRFPGVIAPAAVGYGLAAAVGLINTEPVPHPYEVPLWPATAAAVVVAAIAAALTYRLFREMPIPRRTAIAAGAFVAVGTPLWSVSASALWTHGITHALLVGILLASLRDRLILAAVLAAAVVTVRPHLVVAVLPLAFIHPTWPRRIQILAGAGVGLVMLTAYSLWVFGVPLPAAGYDVERLATGSIPLLSPSLMGLNLLAWLIEPRTGIVIYVPIAVIAMFGVRAAWAGAPRWVRLAAVSAIAYAATQLSLARATGGAIFFGHRTTIEAFVLAAPLLLLAVRRVWHEGTIARGLVALTLVYSVGLHGYGAVVDMSAEERRFIEEHRQRTGPQAAAPQDLAGDVGSLRSLVHPDRAAVQR